MDLYKIRLIVIFALFQIICSSCASLRTEDKKPLPRNEKARLLVDVANTAIIEGDHVGAFQNLALAEELDSSLPEIYHSKALAYMIRSEIDLAINECKKAVKIAPEYSEANTTLGKILLDQGKYKESIPYLLKAAKNPYNREAYKAYTNLGILEYRRSNYEQAVQYFDLAILQAPMLSCIAHYYKGHLAMRDANFHEALQEYEKATFKFCVNFADAHLAQGITLEKSRQFEKARKKFAEIQQKFPKTKVAVEAMNHLRTLP